MSLLFDQNLSFRLAVGLVDLFPGCVHGRDVGLGSADDDVVWEFALHGDLAIVSKDGDFHQRSLLSGHPPKVVWIRLGNCTTDDVETLIRTHSDDIRRFLQDAESSFLALG